MGKFKPGLSGNPAGRPKGSRNKLTRICGDLLSADAADIMAVLVRRAKKGDAVALRLCVERLLPLRVSRDRSVELVGVPKMQRAQDLVQAAAAVIERAAAGDLTLPEAREFLSLLELERRTLETADLAVRLEVLEGGVSRDGSGPYGFVGPKVEAPDEVA